MNNVDFIDGHGNQGISRAINVAAGKAIKMNYKWLITFDQDSVAHGDMIDQMREFVDTYNQIEKVGIVSPTIRNPLIKFKKVKDYISYNDWVIQSGAMHNLEAYQKINGYDEKLFIDQVDIEYCVRLTLNKYKIIKLNHAVLIHNTLDDKVKLINQNGQKIFANKFTPMRYYYFTRNNLYCAKKYKKINYQYYVQLKRNISILLHTLPHEKKKFPRLQAIITGYLDYKMNLMGKTNRKF